MSQPEPSPEYDTIYFDNGDYYEGDAINRVPHGTGTMYYANGITRTCEWLYGLPLTRPKPDTKIPGYSDEHYQKLITVNGNTFCVGFGYDNDTLADSFGISRFIRGIRIHHNRAVLLSTGTSVYRDGIGWEKDSDGEYVFEYTGEGLDGNQLMNGGNYFLKNSDGGLFLFVKRNPNDYVFFGEVEVKRIEEAIEPDRNGIARKVFKFILRRVAVE